MSINTRKSIVTTNRTSSRLPAPILDFAARTVKSLNLNKFTRGRRATRFGNSVFKTVAEKSSKSPSLLPGIEFLMYYGESRAGSHYAMWDPVFRRTGVEYASIFRHPNTWYEALPDNNCFPMATITQVEPLLGRLPNLKVIFYAANNGNNLQMVRNSQYTHVFLGHGDSGKASSANKVFRLYDEVWVAGDAHVDRFNNISGDFSSIDFHRIGQPWLRDFLMTIETQRKERNSVNDTGRNIGYFPTWSGYYTYSNYSSLREFDWIARALEDYVPDRFDNLYAKIHPRTSRADKEVFKSHIADRDWIENLDIKTSLNEALLKDIGLCICDNSSSVTESLYLGVPILLYFAPEANYDSDFKNSFDFCYFFSNEDELRAHLKTLYVDKKDSLAKRRKDKLNYLVDLDAMRNDKFDKELERLLKVE